jgi:4-amino-4-deoxy-L-arabinose transferase-like glycosyltransferase
VSSGTADALGELLHRVPIAAWACAAVACLSAVCWSLITPPFQAPDEPNHIAYVKELSQTGGLPSAHGSFSATEKIAMEALDASVVAGNPELRGIATAAEERQLERYLARSKRAPGQVSTFAGEAASEPPLYYALETIPFALGSSGTLLDQIELMRLLSALMAGFTALLSFLFVREALPGVRWAWTVGGLGVALVPLLGFTSGAVTPDATLYAVTAALFYALARAFRRGLTRRLAIALGAVTAVGLLTKLNFVGIVPGALLGLVVLSVRAARSRGRDAYASLALALALALSPAVIYVAAHFLAGGPGLGIVSHAVDYTHGSPSRELSYIWQLYLPRLPGMRADFAGILTMRDIWFRGYVGLYGWFDTTFPHWVYRLALVPALALACLCARALLASAAALRARAGELCVYALVCIGLMGLIGADSYIAFPSYDAEYGQVRYLLPLLPLLAAILALAARGAGRRRGPIVGTAIVLLFAAHDIFSQLQVLARFYG